MKKKFSHITLIILGIYASSCSASYPLDKLFDIAFGSTPKVAADIARLYQLLPAAQQNESTKKMKVKLALGLNKNAPDSELENKLKDYPLGTSRSGSSSASSSSAPSAGISQAFKEALDKASNDNAKDDLFIKIVTDESYPGGQYMKGRPEVKAKLKAQL